MSTTTKSKSQKGVRYTDAQKKEVIDFALSYNAANGRGGQSKAAEKFKISQITIASWLKAAGAPAAKTAKAAKAPKAAKAVKAPKAAKAPKVVGRSKVGTRYTEEQKKEVTGFVASYNAENGRGGQSKAAVKYNISPLTVMAWLKASGTQPKVKKAAKKAAKSVAPGKPAKAPLAVKVAKTSKTVSAGSFDAKLSALLEMSREITRSEAALAQLISRFNSLKASL